MTAARLDGEDENAQGSRAGEVVQLAEQAGRAVSRPFLRVSCSPSTDRLLAIRLLSSAVTLAIPRQRLTHLETSLFVHVTWQKPKEANSGCACCWKLPQRPAVL